MSRLILRAAVSAVLFLSLAPASAATIDTVPVGDPGNAEDPVTSGFGQHYGNVAYSYRIGTFEVTNNQYAEFLNAKAPTDTLALWNINMGGTARGGITRSGSNGSYTYAVKPDMGNMPVVFVSWFDAIRFANWLNNGQGTGDTETGAYTISGGGSYPSNADTITRNANAIWFLPSENEWYKAAYYQPSNHGGDGDGYWEYATRTNSDPYSDQPPGVGAPVQSNTANFRPDDGISNGYNDGYAVTGHPTFDNSVNYLTNVGAYTLSRSYYGTFDQGGNVLEWNEEIGDSYRGLRGGSWRSGGAFGISANFTASQFSAVNERFDVGFRVATIVPEPSTLALAAFALAGLAACSLRRKHRP